MTVHILVTVRNPALLKTALLVFRTLRTGFPTADVVVHGNNLDRLSRLAVIEAVVATGARYLDCPEITHGAWIERLLHHSREPFWIADTDLVFFEKVEHWTFDGLFAGRLEPEFRDPWTGSVHVERLHPSLMWFNPVPLRAALRTWPGLNPFLHTVESHLVRWSMVPRKNQPPLFYDTCAGLHHAIGGIAFTESQDMAFGHLYAGTYSDLMSDRLDLREAHECVCENPELARLLLENQRVWYGKNAVKGEC